MVRLPSVATIARDLADCREDARGIRRLMERYHHTPMRLLSKVSTVLGAHGTEYIQDVNDDIVDLQGISYINMGDGYIPTLMYDHHSGRIFIACWADVVEKNPRRFGH